MATNRVERLRVYRHKGLITPTWVAWCDRCDMDVSYCNTQAQALRQARAHLDHHTGFSEVQRHMTAIEYWAKRMVDQVRHA